MVMKVLIVEDEVRLANNIAKVLKEKLFYSSDISNDGEEGLYYAKTNTYDLIILDLMLPKLSGTQILAKLRDAGIKTPVLILTACDSTESIIDTLDMGCDDYLTKPFDINILMARCKALIRRAYSQPTPIIKIEELEIDTNRFEVRVKNKPVELTAMEFRLLEYLSRRSGEVVSKTEIEEHLYDFGSEKFSNTIEVYISLLRKKIEAELDNKIIHTFRNRGYMIGNK